MTDHRVICQMPLRIISEANSRDHWRTKAGRAKLHRATARAMLQQHSRPQHTGPVSITLTRISSRKLDDDNLASGFKSVRDGVADWLGINDGSERLTWRYAQRKGSPMGCEVIAEWTT